jgi:hypothetical protein
MIPLHTLLLTTMLIPAADVQCPAKSVVPLVEVIPVRKDPTFSYSASSADLSHKGTDAYVPPGASPSWHKGGLTQSSTTFEQKVNSMIERYPDGLTCIYIDKIQLQVTSEPTVWVANDFPPGTCMYNAVKEHEMKHVHAEQTVLATHIGRMKAALEEVGRNRTVFGPSTENDVDARYNQFLEQINATVQNEFDVFKLDEARAQQAIDTIQEYRRISNLCAAQLRQTQ